CFVLGICPGCACCPCCPCAGNDGRDADDDGELLNWFGGTFGSTPGGGVLRCAPTGGSGWLPCASCVRTCGCDGTPRPGVAERCGAYWPPWRTASGGSVCADAICGSGAGYDRGFQSGCGSSSCASVASLLPRGRSRIVLAASDFALSGK